ncbi:hypothetical protein D9M68_956900 [compost metagenome]
MGCGGTGAGNCDAAFGSVRRARGASGSLFHVLQDRLGLFQEGLAADRQRGTLGMAPEEIETELVFERTYLLAERRLLHAEPLRGAREMPLLGNDKKITKMSEFHVCPCAAANRYF